MIINGNSHVRPFLNRASQTMKVTAPATREGSTEFVVVCCAEAMKSCPALHVVNEMTGSELDTESDTTGPDTAASPRAAGHEE